MPALFSSLCRTTSCKVTCAAYLTRSTPVGRPKSINFWVSPQLPLLHRSIFSLSLPSALGLFSSLLFCYRRGFWSHPASYFTQARSSPAALPFRALRKHHICRQPRTSFQFSLRQISFCFISFRVLQPRALKMSYDSSDDDMPLARTNGHGKGKKNSIILSRVAPGPRLGAWLTCHF